MNLATNKDAQVESSPISVPGSPSASQPQNLTGDQKSTDKTETSREISLETTEERQESTSAQHSGEYGVDTRQGVVLSHPNDIVSSIEFRPGVDGSLTATDTVQANGKSASEQALISTEEGQTHHKIDLPPTLLIVQHHSQQEAKEPPEDLSSQPANTALSNNCQAEVLTDRFSSHTPPPPIGSSPHVNGNSVLEAPPLAASTVTASVVPSTSLIPTASPCSEDSQAMSSDGKDAMAVDGNEAMTSNGSAVDDTEPLSKRTRSRQKRLPDPLSKEPSKRARTTSNPSTSSAVLSPSPEKSLNNGSNENGGRVLDAEMHDLPPDKAATTSGSMSTNSGKHSSSSSTSKAPQVQDSAAPPSEPQTAASGAITINTNMGSNLDPALAVASTQPLPLQSTPTSSPPSNEPLSLSRTAEDKATAEASSSGSAEQTTRTTPSPTSTSSLAKNPYIGLSTAFLKGASSPGSTGYNPYALYYGPGTPITPHTPTYAYPYLYHLHSPISAQAIYPTSSSFAPSPTTQKSPSAPSPSTGEPQRQKPKRLKAHTVTSGNHNIPIVPRDKKGKPMLPLNVGIMTVINLGEVCMREHFHTERYIFPVGYEVTRRYLSTVNPTVEVVYHCTILDGGDGPKFQIVPSDAPDRTVIAGTATGAWSNIVKQANAIRNRQHSNSVSGPDFFGLGQNTIKHLIQELPNADRLRDYVWQNFIEGGPLGGRHAAVTPALPEDYDSTLPIGALYPERDRPKRETNSSPRGLNYYPQHIIAQAEAQRKQQTSVQTHPQVDQQAATPILNHSHPSVSNVTTLPALDTRTAISNGHISVPPLSQQPVATTPQPPPVPQPLTTEISPNLQASPNTAPTTIAGIMNAYPVPTANPPPPPAPASPTSSS